jgi:hypothetical protein
MLLKRFLFAAPMGLKAHCGSVANNQTQDMSGMRPIKITLVLLCLIAAACQPSLQVSPRSPRSIAGTWVADPQACAAVGTQLKSALQAARDRELHDAIKRNTKRMRMVDENMTAEGRIDSGSWEVKEQEEQYRAMLDAFTPRPELVITEGSGQIIFAPVQTARRVFEPGGSSTLVTSFAHLRVFSGWQADDFIVTSTDGKADVAVTERYRLQPDHSLLLSVTISLKYMDTQQYSLVYRKRSKA